MKYKNHKFIIQIIPVIILIFVANLNTVFGESSTTSFLGVPSLGDVFLQFIGWGVNLALMATSLFVSITAAFLNESIIITMHIRELVDSTPVIYEIWKIIRDISGLFFIFVLLYEAIKIILGLDAKISGVIKNIVFAGILINFSFFFVSVMIDASNVVSQALYNSMIPNSPTINASDFLSSTPNSKGKVSGGLRGLTEKYFTGVSAKGSITDIFMQSLSIQNIYNKDMFTGQKTYTASGNSLNNSGTASKFAASIKIILIGIVGIIIMITTSLSFLLAAIAFIIRLVILLFLLAFSPLLFAGMIVPKIGEYTKDFRGELESQLVFMPVYLLLMYAALRVLNESKIFGIGYSGDLYQAASGTSAVWGTDLIVLAINFAMVIIMLNFPLLAAFKMGGKATKMLDGWSKKIDAANIWKNVGSWSKTTLYNDTVSRGASRLAQNESFQKIAGKSWFGEQALRATRTTGAGFDKRLKEQIARREEFNKSLSDEAKTAYASRLSGTIPAKLSMAGTVGRADRVAAARILKARKDEIITNRDKLISELNQINNAAINAGGLQSLPLYQQQRHALLDRGNPNNLIDKEEQNLRDIEREISNFENSTGVTIKETNKRNY